MKTTNKVLLGLYVVLGLFLSSCGEVCVRCENGATAETETECFIDDNERAEYVATREALGFTCNNKE
ncbi:MAG: hypothetical protein R2836_03255 [Chitinophagales bacterium]|nr:hypothetical protein [Bacteroidota bacterium]MCB9226229.1 hypothetical protein [Chitinophagales bacterium]